jgi:anti-sigma factor (TIGR02949 family)
LRRLTCREVILDHLDDYLDGTLSREVVEEFERHLSVCPPCVAYLNTYRRTRELTRGTGSVDMPERVKANLREFLLEHLATE